MTAHEHEAWRELGARMAAAGYDELGFATRLGLAPPITLRPGDEIRLARRLDRSDELGELIARWFLGLEGGAVAVRITPDAGALVASDPVEPERPDQVTGPDNAARLLARLTPRDRVGNALDLGCGNGIQALRCARHADHVVATDLNARAIELTEISAALSAVTNIETRRGSWLAPVADDRFDLVVCNPPFVIGDDGVLAYRSGDAHLAQRLVDTVPAVLAPGGIAVMLANWTAPPTPSSRADTLVLRMASESAPEYAERWCEPLRLRRPDAYRERLDAWLARLAAIGVERIVSGAIVLRRRDAPAHHVLDVPGGVTGAAGEHVLRVLDAMEAEPTDEAVARSTPTLADGLRLERSRYHDGGWSAADPTIRAVDGLGVELLAPDPIDRFVLALDGERTVSDAAAETGADAHGAIAFTRALREHGLLRASAPSPGAPDSDRQR